LNSRRRILLFETELCWFILVGALDAFLTYILLRASNQGYSRSLIIEGNPVARWVLHQWGMQGMIIFKCMMIVIVVVIAEIVGRQRPMLGRGLLWVGTAVVASVVIYSARMLAQHV
jgi:Domain of unknown function (DUF5658)